MGTPIAAATTNAATTATAGRAQARALGAPGGIAGRRAGGRTSGPAAVRAAAGFETGTAAWVDTDGAALGGQAGRGAADALTIGVGGGATDA
jgi:hypothetical protein